MNVGEIKEGYWEGEGRLTNQASCTKEEGACCHGIVDRFNKAGLPKGFAASGFNSHDCCTDIELVKLLAQGDWINQGYSVVLQGPPGLGKTLLAIESGRTAIY